MAGANDSTSAQRRAAFGLALTAGAFCLIVAGIMLALALAGGEGEVPTSTRLEALRAGYGGGASDAATREQLRQEDRRVREAYHRRAALLRRGARMLLVGGAVLGVAMAWLVLLRPILPAIPKPDSDAGRKERADSRRAVTVVVSVGLFLLGVLLGMGWRALAERPAAQRPSRVSEAER